MDISPPPPTPRPQAAGILLAGTLMAASAALWIRNLPEVPPMMIGFVRVAGAALLFLPLFIRQWRQRRPAWREFRYSLAAGAALALHFATWITSLRYTTVAHSVLLVATHPVFVIAISLLLLRLPVRRNQIAGAAIAMLGVVTIHWLAAGDVLAARPEANPALGNLLALLGGLFAAVYLLLGQAARRSLSTILHVEATYATAAVLLLLFSALAGQVSLPKPGADWLFLGLLVLLPTAGGHTIFNWGVRHLGAPVVSLFGLLEPLESALLALLFLGEAVGLATLAGGAIIITGLAVAVRRG